MIQKQFFTVIAPALAALIVAGACKSEEGDDNAMEMVTASTTTPTTGVPPMPTGSATGTGTGTGVVGTANPLPTPTGTPTTPPTGTPTTAPTDTAPMCTNVEDGQGVNPMGPFGATWLFGYSDSTTAACLVKTTHCLDTATPGKFCFNGTAADAMAKYECWGAGIGLQMALADATSVKMPWDAAALGIAGVKFTIAGVAGGPKVRAQLSIAGLPDDATYPRARRYQDQGVAVASDHCTRRGEALQLLRHRVLLG
jgi:hypothetical protein